jgi:hypothetical protein
MSVRFSHHVYLQIKNSRDTLIASISSTSSFCLPDNVQRQRRHDRKILATWRRQGTFIRFLDGNTGNNAVSNLAFVSLPEALKHIDDWVVDWDQVRSHHASLVLACVDHFLPCPLLPNTRSLNQLSCIFFPYRIRTSRLSKSRSCAHPRGAQASTPGRRHRLTPRRRNRYFHVVV